MTLRRLLVPLGLILLLMALALPLANLAPAAATAPTARVSDAGTATPTTTLPEDNSDRSVIPLPNSGRKPEAPGDRGGWAQLLLFGILLAGSGFIFVRVLWAARQRQRHQRQP